MTYRVAASLVTALVAITAAIASTSANLAARPGQQQSIEPPTPLCASAGTVTRLVVRRTDAFPQNHFRFSFPASVVVNHAAAVRSVARALCALPAIPDQAMFCPAGFGITYHLEFSRPQQYFRVVTVEATGCQVVRGLVQARWTARSPDFWRVLGTALGLESPSWATFRGTGPNG